MIWTPSHFGLCLDLTNNQKYPEQNLHKLWRKHLKVNNKNYGKVYGIPLQGIEIQVT